eukprot:TRINITY_DN21643_c0_g1_i4.p1 TRINITY_DN21643_c0_g1~~TRINITY_DN21643_c0_g1_i4.p1  ORF type:complete len:272 (-),score=-4.55 TRINITY_DN21643_c0_g1_i4:240-1055(-)
MQNFPCLLFQILGFDIQQIVPPVKVLYPKKQAQLLFKKTVQQRKLVTNASGISRSASYCQVPTHINATNQKEQGYFFQNRVGQKKLRESALQPVLWIQIQIFITIQATRLCKIFAKYFKTNLITCTPFAKIIKIQVKSCTFKDTRSQLAAKFYIYQKIQSFSVITSFNYQKNHKIAFQITSHHDQIQPSLKKIHKVSKHNQKQKLSESPTYPSLKKFVSILIIQFIRYKYATINLHGLNLIYFTTSSKFGYCYQWAQFLSKACICSTNIQT